jgi:hypothetical protein
MAVVSPIPTHIVTAKRQAHQHNFVFVDAESMVERLDLGWNFVTPCRRLLAPIGLFR